MGTRETTTIEVSMETWQELQRRKERPGMSFDDVIQLLLNNEVTHTVDTETAKEVTRTENAVPDETTTEPDQVDLSNVDYPARGEYQREARADAIRHAYALIREHGKIETGEMMDAVWDACDREEIGYSASTADDRKVWWQLYDNCVATALKQLDDIRAPPPRSTPSVWRWVDA